MKPLTFLLETVLTVIRKVISLLKTGQIDEAISNLESLETDVEKYKDE